MARIIITAFLCLFLGTWQRAGAQTLGLSNENITLTGLGADANGDGTVQVQWGNCSYDGTNTNCNLTGAFTGLGPGGTYDFLLSYPGNGVAPFTGTSVAPGSDLLKYVLTGGSLTLNLNESDGTSVSFHRFVYTITFVQGSTVCSGNPSNCDVGTVGLTPGATITGPVTGTFAVAPIIQTVISAGDYGGFATIAPGTWIEIYGQGLATATKEWGSSDFTNNGEDAPIALGGTTVTVGGKSAFIDYVSSAQVNVQVPSDVGTGSQAVIVTTAGGSSTPFAVTVNATQPGLLAPSAFKISKKQYAVALFADGFYDLPPGTGGVAARRAVPGDTIMLYGIGFGPVTPDNPAGVVVQDANALNTAPHFSIGGTEAQVQYDGLTAGFLGLYQFNLVIPDIPASDTTPLTFTMNGVGGQQTLYLFIGN